MPDKKDILDELEEEIEKLTSVNNGKYLYKKEVLELISIMKEIKK